MIITRSPLRVTLGGGGSDVPSYYRNHEGFLISAAIDRYIYIALHETFIKDMIIKYSCYERVSSIDKINHPIIREALKLVDIKNTNIELASMADIPEGTGLGSSGAFTCLLLKSLHTYKKNLIHPSELVEILRMPSRSGRSASGAANMGIFIHRVLETAVKRKISTRKELLEIRDRTHTKPDYKNVDLPTATSILEVFWRRNKDSIKYNLLVEKRFIIQLDDFYFKGFIDRIDLIPGSKNEIEVADYKSGKYEPGPVERSRQLLLYAKGAEHLLPKHKVKRLKLEELSLPTSRVFEWNGEEFECISSSRMDPLDNTAISDMIEIAKKVAYDYEHGFKKTKNEKTCEECGFNLYCKE